MALTNLQYLLTSVAQTFGIDTQVNNTNNGNNGNDDTPIFSFSEVNDDTMEDIVKSYVEARVAMGYSEEEAIKELEDMGVDTSSYELEDSGETGETDGTSSSKKVPKFIQSQIDKLEEEKEKNNGDINQLEAQIEKLEEKAQDEIMKATKQQEKITAEFEEEAKAVLKQQLNDYTEANKEGGEGMTREQLAANIEGALPGEQSLRSAIAHLTAASEIVDEIDECLGEMSKLVDANKNIETKVNALSKVTSSTSTAQSLLEEKGVTISDEEWALADANEVDLSERLEDGSARYIFAKGKSDDQYHIYDMLNGGASLARQYGNDGGFDIIESGSGYLYDYQDLGSETENGSTVYSMTECGTLEETQACYQTCSPLSFDIDGNGVGTSDNIVEYDIDGDGEVDRIYDSADAVLVFDADKDGTSGENGSECFGNNTDLSAYGIEGTFDNGFDALKAMAAKEGFNADGKLDADELSQLQEKYGLQIKTGGYNSEAQSLSDVGITEINLGSTDEVNTETNFDGKHNDLMTQEGATFTVNGKTRDYADLWHAKLDENGEPIPAEEETEEFEFSSTIQEQENFLNFHTEYAGYLRDQINQAYTEIGFTQEGISEISDSTKAAASQVAQNFFANELSKKEEDEIEISEAK